MIKACIFDLDGTLADTLESIAVATNAALATVNLEPLPVENFKYYAGDGAKTLIERALKAAGDASLQWFDQVYGVYTEIFKKDCTYKTVAFDGIAQMLEGLKARGIKTAVLSNKPHERTLDVVYKLFGTETFDYVQGQCDAIEKKPDPSGALMICKALSLEPWECMYIGDTNVDMLTGNRAGMYTVGVLWGFRTIDELERYQAHKIVSHPQHILGLVDMKNQGMTAVTPIRLIVTDVDGTLVEEGSQELEDGFMDTVNQWMGEQKVFAIASGRQVSSVLRLFKESSRPLYVVGENGGHLYYNGKTLAFYAFAQHEYWNIIETVKAYAPESLFAIATPEYYYTESGHDDFIWRLENTYNFNTAIVDNVAYLDLPVCKVAIYTDRDVNAFARHFEELWDDHLEITVSGAHWIDITPKGVSKGRGVSTLQKLLGVSLEETMIFGDNGNDVSMFGCARYSCAVSNAKPAAKRAAAYETDSVLGEIKKLLS